MENMPPPPPGEETTQARVTKVVRGVIEPSESLTATIVRGLSMTSGSPVVLGIPGLEIDPARPMTDQGQARSAFRRDPHLSLVSARGAEKDELARISGIDDDGLVRRQARARVRHLSGPLALLEEVAHELALGIELQHLVLIGQEERAPGRGPQLARS